MQQRSADDWGRGRFDRQPQNAALRVVDPEPLMSCDRQRARGVPAAAQADERRLAVAQQVARRQEQGRRDGASGIRLKTLTRLAQCPLPSALPPMEGCVGRKTQRMTSTGKCRP